MKFKKSIRSLLVGALALVMILSLSAVPAMALEATAAAGSGPDYLATTTVATTPAEAYQHHLLTFARYEWSAPLRRQVAVYELHPASKVSLTLERIYPIDRIESDTAVLRVANDRYRALKGLVYSGQTQPLWYYLSWQTQSKINGSMDAEQALKLIKAQPDYYNNGYVKWYVDTYLGQTLSTGMVESALSKLYGFDDQNFMQVVKLSSVSELLAIAEQTIATNEYQALRRALMPFRDCSHDAASLCYFYNDAQLQQYYSALRSASQSYSWRDYFTQLDSVTFSIPQ